MASDSNRKIIIVALGVCAVCSVLVSVAAVGLRPRQKENQRLEKLRNILDAGGLFEKKMDLEKVYGEKIRAFFVRLEDGSPMPLEEIPAGITTEAFDVERVAADPATGRLIPDEADRARIRRIPVFMPVYGVLDGSEISKIILPVHGKGLWSTMYGFMALDRDLKTILAFTFYEHGETPGLGGEIDNPRWKALWQGKSAFDDQGRLRIEVMRGAVERDDPEARFRVDGISGATKTTQGVQELVRFWLGDSGYGPFIVRARKEGLNGGE